MKNFFKICLFSFFLLYDFVMFAQPGDDDDNGGGSGLEGTDPAPAPINSKLIFLAIAGIIFVIYKYRAVTKKA